MLAWPQSQRQRPGPRPQTQQIDSAPVAPSTPYSRSAYRGIPGVSVCSCHAHGSCSHLEMTLISESRSAVQRLTSCLRPGVPMTFPSHRVTDLTFDTSHIGRLLCHTQSAAWVCKCMCCQPVTSSHERDPLGLDLRPACHAGCSRQYAVTSAASHSTLISQELRRHDADLAIWISRVAAAPVRHGLRHLHPVSRALAKGERAPVLGADALAGRRRLLIPA